MYRDTEDVIYIPGNHPETMIAVPREEWIEQVKKAGVDGAKKYFQELDSAGVAELEYFRKV